MRMVSDDGEEIRLDLNPISADTDGDNISDGEELALKTDPGNPDSDNDGVNDGDEVKAGTNPLDGIIASTDEPQLAQDDEAQQDDEDLVIG